MTAPAVAPATSKTPAEIAALKRNWLADPCWDIEDTEGFEAHRDELQEWRFSLEIEAQQRQERLVRDRAFTLGVSGNLALAGVILHLEQRIRDFERRVSELEAQRPAAISISEELARR